MSSDNPGDSRRSVLKKVAGGAAASAAFAGVATAVPPPGIDSTKVKSPEERIQPDREVASFDATTSDCCCCETEYKCEDTCSKDGSYEQAYKRECCQCGGDTICEDWQTADRCCL